MIVQLILASRTGTRELEDEVSCCFRCLSCDHHRSKWTWVVDNFLPIVVGCVIRTAGMLSY